jgi:UDP-N-acetylglucosamine transferase subunit ALG13
VASPPLPAPGRPTPGRHLRVFVVTGTGPPFERLLAAAALLAEDGSLELFVQRGRPTPTGRALPGEDLLPRAVFAERLRWADVVVTHAGAGSLLEAFRAGHTPIAVPRLRRFGEVVNDHQIDLGRALAAEGKAIVCEDLEALPGLVRAAPVRQGARVGLGEPLIAAVREALRGGKGGAGPGDS